MCSKAFFFSVQEMEIETEISFPDFSASRISETISLSEKKH